MSAQALVLGAASYLSGAAWSSPVPVKSLDILQPRQSVDPGCSCPVKIGKSDLYGPGIRIGVYLQWMTALLANNFFFNEVGGQLATNTIFLVAIVVATIVLASQGKLYQADYAILVRLGFGFTLSVLSVAGRRIVSGGLERFFLVYNTEAVPSLTMLWVRRVLCMLIYSFSLWFWIAMPTGPGESSCCTTYFFFASKQRASVGFRGFEAAVSLFLLLCHCFALLWDVCMGLAIVLQQDQPLDFVRNLLSWDAWVAANYDATFNLDLIRLGWLGPQMWQQIVRKIVQKLSPRLSRQKVTERVYIILTSFEVLFFGGKAFPLSDLDHCYPASLHRFLSIIYSSILLIPWLNAAYAVWAIVGIELTISWNSLQDLPSIATTGQLIPLVIGLVSLGKVAAALNFELAKRGVRYKVWQRKLQRKKAIVVKHGAGDTYFRYIAGDNPSIHLAANTAMATAPRWARHSVSDIPQRLREPERIIWSAERVTKMRDWKRRNLVRPWERRHKKVQVRSKHGTKHGFVKNMRYTLREGLAERSTLTRRWSHGEPQHVNWPPFLTVDDLDETRVPGGKWRYPTPKGDVLELWDRRYWTRRLSCPDLGVMGEGGDDEDSTAADDSAASGPSRDWPVKTKFKSNKTFVQHLASQALALTAPAGDVVPDGRRDRRDEVLHYLDDGMSDVAYTDDDLFDDNPDNALGAGTCLTFEYDYVDHNNNYKPPKPYNNRGYWAGDRVDDDNDKDDDEGDDEGDDEDDDEDNENDNHRLDLHSGYSQRGPRRGPRWPHARSRPKPYFRSYVLPITHDM